MRSRVGLQSGVIQYVRVVFVDGRKYVLCVALLHCMGSVGVVTQGAVHKACSPVTAASRQKPLLRHGTQRCKLAGF